MVRYNVGQVLYVIMKKEARVYPFYVVEEITKRTLDGETVTYMVRGGTDEKSQLLITEIDGEVFDSPEKARQSLVNRATSQVNKLVDAAIKKAREWYPNSFEEAGTAFDASNGVGSKKASDIRAIPDHGHITTQEDATIITMPDGTTAKVRSVKLPETMG